MQVTTIMTTDPVSVTPDTSLDEALLAMDEFDLRHLPVLEEGKLVGLLSDRDLLEATGWLPSRVHEGRGAVQAAEVPKLVREVMSDSVHRIGHEDSIAAAAVELIHHGIGCLPVTKNARLVGMLTEMDVVSACADGQLKGITKTALNDTVAEHMTESPCSIQWDTTLGAAMSICSSNGIRHLPVIESGQLVGMVSDRDLRRALGSGRHEDMPMNETMTKNPLAVAPDMILADAARSMFEHRFSSLPVVDDGELVGILTVADILDHCLDTSLERGESAEPLKGD